MKAIKLYLNFLGLILFSVILAALTFYNTGNEAFAIIIGALVFASGFMPKGVRHALFLEAPDVSAITSAFVKFGGDIIKKKVNKLSIAGNNFYRMYKNVNQPIVLPKASASGNPRPYNAADAQTTGIVFGDRTLTVYQSKWDIDFDFEKFRNTYLASGDERPFYQFMLDQASDEFMAQLNDGPVYLGVYDGSGTTAIKIATGWGTHIADAITAVTLVPIATGAVDDTNAVDKHEVMLSALPAWARERGDVEAIMSYAQFDNYKKHYRATYNFTFQPRQDGFYYLDGTNIKLRPESFMGTSNRFIYTIAGNLCWGTDGDSIQVAASLRRNIVETRLMMPIGFQIGDLAAIFVNDQA